MESTGTEIPVKLKGFPLSNVAKFITVVSPPTDRADLSYSLESGNGESSKFLVTTNTTHAS